MVPFTSCFGFLIIFFLPLSLIDWECSDDDDDDGDEEEVGVKVTKCDLL